LLSAGIQGARDGAGQGNEPRIMLHHDQGTNWTTTSYYFDRLLPRLATNGTDIDVIGYSYYPIFHSGGIAALQQNLNNTAAAYGKPVMVVETGFPFRNPTSSEQNLGFPVTEAGQQSFLAAVVDSVKNVPQGMGQGVFWWYAEARPTTGLSVWQNGRYGLFDQTGNLNDATQVFEQFIPLLAGDYNDNAVVDAADYVLWRKSNNTATTLPNDATPGTSSADYDVWRSYFGQSAGGSFNASAAVPEPCAAILLLGAAAGFLLNRRGSSRWSRSWSILRNSTAIDGRRLHSR
jgi:hypothetical protein